MNHTSPQVSLWTRNARSGPILATAIHHGHEVRPEIAHELMIGDAERLREEDPYTGQLTTVGDSTLIVHRSRFEVDLNRPREKAVYRAPEDAWGLSLWNEPPSEDLLKRSLQTYDAFYEMLFDTLTRMKEQHGRFVVLDLHSYNHHRQGPRNPFDDPAMNPEIDVGTDTLRNRTSFAPLIDGFIDDLRRVEFMGRTLDVRENIRFGNGWMGEWIHRNFEGFACVLSVEFKKTFMDEWTGNLNQSWLVALHAALAATIPRLHNRLQP